MYQLCCAYSEPKFILYSILSIKEILTETVQRCLNFGEKYIQGTSTTVGNITENSAEYMHDTLFNIVSSNILMTKIKIVPDFHIECKKVVP